MGGGRRKTGGGGGGVKIETSSCVARLENGREVETDVSRSLTAAAPKANFVSPCFNS